MKSLMRVENITDADLAELWPDIGGAPHLFEYGKEELRTGLIDGNWSESTLQMDFYTMRQMLKRMEALGYDVDLLIDQGLAIEGKPSSLPASASPLPLLVEGRERPAFPLDVSDEVFKEASASAYLSPEEVYNEGTSSAYIQGFCVAHARFSTPLPVSDTGEKPEPSPEALETAARSKHSLSEVIDNQEAPEPFDLIAWCAEETKYLAQRDKDFFYMGSGDLYRYLSGKGMLTEPDDTWHHKVDRMYEVICTGEDYEKELQAEISSLKGQLDIETALTASFNKAAGELMDERHDLKDENNLLKKQLLVYQLELPHDVGNWATDTIGMEELWDEFIVETTEEDMPDSPVLFKYQFSVAMERVMLAVRADRNRYAKLSEEIATLKEQLADRDTQIEILRKNGASLRPGNSILDVLKWGNEKIDRRYQGQWVMKFHLLAFTDEKVVEEFLKDHPGRTPHQEEDLKAHAIAFALDIWPIPHLSGSMTDMYDQWRIGEANKNLNHKAE